MSNFESRLSSSLVSLAIGATQPLICAHGADFFSKNRQPLEPELPERRADGGRHHQLHVELWAPEFEMHPINRGASVLSFAGWRTLTPARTLLRLGPLPHARAQLQTAAPRWNHFCFNDSTSPEWLLRLPMTKSVSRARRAPRAAPACLSHGHEAERVPKPTAMLACHESNLKTASITARILAASSITARHFSLRSPKRDLES